MIIDNEVCRDAKKWMDNNPDIPEGWIYLGNEKERYVLGQPGDKNILVFGVNPSTAVAGKDDPTIRKVRSISQHDGFDGWIMVNLYPGNIIVHTVKHIMMIKYWIAVPCFRARRLFSTVTRIRVFPI